MYRVNIRMLHYINYTVVWLAHWHSICGVREEDWAVLHISWPDATAKKMYRPRKCMWLEEDVIAGQGLLKHLTNS